MKKSSRYIYLTGIFVASAFFMAMLPGKNVEAKAKAPKGIEIDGTDVSGMTEDEVNAIINAYMTGVNESTINIKTSENTITAKASELGVKNMDPGTAKKAVNYLSKGNPLERYSRKAYLKAGNTKKIRLSLACDRAVLQDYVEKNKAALSKEAVDNGLRRENGAFTYIEGTEGREIVIEDSVKAINDFVETEWNRKDGEVDLETKVVKPRGSKEELSKVKDLLGTATTDYSTSGASRKHNVAKGASFLNGLILYPGDVVSVYDKVSPLSIENGYQVAGGYANGQNVEAEGGGICQVATTTYDAVIQAELGIETRSAHSLTVHYVDIAFDAAIAAASDGTALKDMQFKNNLDAPVYIETMTNGSKITVNVYGQETRPANRKVEYKNEVQETYNIVNKYTEDPTAPVGTIKKISSGSVGYKCRLWKIVTVDGVEESRKIQNRSNYKMAEGSYSVGTFSEDPAATAMMQEALATKDQTIIENTAAQFTGVMPNHPQPVIGMLNAEKAAADAKAAAEAQAAQDALNPAPVDPAADPNAIVTP